MEATTKPRRRKAVKPANWTAGGWPRPEFRLPDLDVLEALSRAGPIDGDQTAKLAVDVQHEFNLGGDAI